MGWATREQAWAHWPDSQSIPDATLDTLLDVATEQAAAYAPSLVHLVDATLLSGSNVATATNGALFSAKDVGGVVDGSGIALGTTVLSVASSGETAVLSAAATATLTLSSLGVTRLVTDSHMLAVVYHARDLWAGGQAEGGEIIGFGDYAIRRRPLSTTVRSLLRPHTGVKAVG